MYEPHNPRSNLRLLRRILVQPRSTLDGLRAAIDRWEADLVEYVQRGNQDLSDPQKITVLLSMVPESLEDHLEMNIGRLDTYAKARSEVISYTEQKAAKADADSGGAVPMELDAFKGQPKGGKSGGKGGRDQAKGNPDKDIICHHCGKKGHRKSNCWQAAKGTGKASKGHGKDSKGHGKDSKGGKAGKAKGGKGKAHVLEGADVEQQEWPAEEEPEAAEGSLGYLCVLGRGPSAASAPAPPKALKRPMFCKQYSWCWSQPWKKVLAECAKIGEPRGDELFRCPVPGCMKGRRTFQGEDSLSQHLWSKSGTRGHPLDVQFLAWEAELKRGHFVRLDPPGASACLREPIEHCDADDPQWVYLPAEPDYSRHEPNESEPPVDVEEESEEEETAEEDPVTEEVKEDSVEEVSKLPAHSNRGRSPLRRQRVARSPLPRRRAPGVQPKSRPKRPAPKPRREDARIYVPPHRRLPDNDLEIVEDVQGKPEEEKVSESPPSSSKGSGAVSSSKRAPAPYGVTTGSRAVLLGELLSRNNDRLGKLRLSLDTAEDEATYKAISDEIATLTSTIDGLKEEQKSFRAKTAQGHSARQEADKAALGGRLAYLKEKSRKRAAKKRLEGQNVRTLGKLDREREWYKRFDRPGASYKAPEYPLAEGDLRHYVAAAPLSRNARTALLEEEEKDFLSLPPVSKRTTTLPPSELKRTGKKRKAKHLRDRRREQRKKAKRDSVQGRTLGVGHLASLSGTTSTALSDWKRVDFVIDSGASATTIPEDLVDRSAQLAKAVGYHSFKLADGTLVPNRGTLRTQAWLLGDETVMLRMAVAKIAQPLMSVAQLVAQGNEVILSPKLSYLRTAGGWSHRIFERNGVYVLLCG